MPCMPSENTGGLRANSDAKASDALKPPCSASEKTVILCRLVERRGEVANGSRHEVCLLML